MPPFEQIVTEHGAVVLRVCRAMLPPADADDAWSETFLAALRAYPDLPPGSNVRAWLATIAHRKAIDRHRAAARAPVPAGALPDRPSPHGIPTEPDTGLWAAVRALPPKQRAALLLRFAGDLSHREVAAALGCSEEAARRSAHEGLKRLREELAA